MRASDSLLGELPWPQKQVVANLDAACSSWLHKLAVSWTLEGERTNQAGPLLKCLQLFNTTASSLPEEEVLLLDDRRCLYEEFGVPPTPLPISRRNLTSTWSDCNHHTSRRNTNPPKSYLEMSLPYIHSQTSLLHELTFTDGRRYTYSTYQLNHQKSKPRTGEAERLWSQHGTFPGDCVIRISSR